jgi:hypothetical protein
MLALIFESAADVSMKIQPDEELGNNVLNESTRPHLSREHEAAVE